MSKRELKKLEELILQYQKSIVNFHYRFVGDRFEAENLAQETFIKVYLNFKTLKDKKKIKSWVFSIARHVVIDFFRKNKNREVALDSAVIENFTQADIIDFNGHIDKDEISRELEKCIDQLSPQDKTLIKLLYFEGFSYKEIGELMKMNQNTLKSRLHRARSVLMEVIQANDLLREVALQYK